MTWTNVQNLVAENYYRSGVPDNQRETIIELPTPEYLETIGDLKSHFTEFRNDKELGIFNFTSVGIPGLGTVRIVPGKERKVFYKADIIWFPEPKNEPEPPVFKFPKVVHSQNSGRKATITFDQPAFKAHDVITADRRFGQLFEVNKADGNKVEVTLIDSDGITRIDNTWLTKGFEYMLVTTSVGEYDTITCGPVNHL